MRSLTVLLIFLLVFVVGCGTTGMSTVDDVQKVQLTMEGGTYVLKPSVLMKDVPVELEADLSSLHGCMRDVVISEFAVRKLVSETDKVISFTPDKTGTFGIACSMNMGTGTFSVK
jgi:plastocyanin domain-containing protein